MPDDTTFPGLPDAGLDTTVSHSARIWNYWLGGKDNYAVDREAGDKVAAMLPSIVTQARADRAFLGRAVRYLAGEAAIRQFLDIGTGLPTADNTHQVAQRVAPEARIVYADNDPLVLTHARALLTSTPEGACDFLDGDLRKPEEILTRATRTLDLARPVALMLLGILHHIPDTDEAYAIVGQLMAALAPGSFLVVNHSTSAVHGAAMEEAVRHWNRVGTPSMTLRSPEQITRFFDGLELLEPGIVSCSRWRPHLTSSAGQPAEVDEFCGVARKPEPAMDIDDMDVEEFAHRWREARRNWERVNQNKLRREISGPRLGQVELAEWNRARAEFEAAERQWDEAYRAGVVIVVANEDETGG